MSLVAKIKEKYWTLHSSQKNRSRRRAAPQLPPIVLQASGYCPVCSTNVQFSARDAWLRENYQCSNCGSVPRERALFVTLEKYFADWRRSTIHESSPVNRGASKRLAEDSRHYISSQLFPNVALGEMVDGVRCENLERLTFADDSIDLHITQDVLEHVLHPSLAFREIARTLKPGGAHIFTVPIPNESKPSKVRARIDERGEILHLAEPVYHGNPVSEKGALVTVDWGFDICQHIFAACGLFTHLICIDDETRGIKGELLHVLVTLKPGAAVADTDPIP